MDEIPFGQWLRQRRRELDLTQEILASQAGCARITLRRIENGSLKPSRELAWLLLDRLGIPERERSRWLRLARGVPEESPSALQVWGNLPAALTSFIGREKEQADLIRLLQTYRMVTLTGSGGVGKTRLSIQAGGQVKASFPDGVWLVELAALNDPERIEQLLAGVLCITPSLHTSPGQKIVQFLQEKCALILLDNCEHLLDPCAHLAERLLKNCPGLKILATSREPLGVTGEAIYRVPSLEVPDLEQMLDTLRGYDSVRLFEERARLVQTDFRLSPENFASIAQVCSRLDGIPLAVELAAARINLIEPQQMAVQLKNGFPLLAGGSRTALPRQRTMRASIDWSWNLLQPQEQVLFRRLAVFADGWTAELAQPVCGTGSEAMEALVNKSLAAADRSRMGRTRFHYHELIRQYAFEKLKQSGELAAVQEAHARAVGNFVEAVWNSVSGSEEVAWFTQMDEEMENVRQAVEWTLANRQAWLAFSAGRLYQYWYQRKNQREPLVWLERAFALPDESTRFERAHALNGAGKLCNDLREPRRAQAYLQDGLALFRLMDDRRGISWCLNNLGIASWMENDFETARSFYEESLEFAPPGSFTVAMTLNNLGNLARMRADWEESRQYFLRARDICVGLGAEAGISYADMFLTVLAVVKRDLVEAQACYERYAHASWVRTDPRIQESFAAIQGYIYFLSGRTQDARAALLLALKAASGLTQGTQSMFAVFLLEGLAFLEKLEGHAEIAAQLFGAAWKRREIDKLPLMQPEAKDYQAAMTILRDALGEDRFQAMYCKGQAMAIEDALAFARKTYDPSEQAGL